MMEDLPTEILLIIFGSLDVKELCRSCEVSTKWKSVIETHNFLWRDLYFRRWKASHWNKEKESLSGVHELSDAIDWKQQNEIRYGVYRSWRRTDGTQYKNKRKRHRSRRPIPPTSSHVVKKFNSRYWSPISAIQFDNKKLVVGDFAGNLTMFSMSTLQRFLSVPNFHSGRIKCLQFNTNFLATGSTDDHIFITDLATGTILHRFRDQDTVNTLTFERNFDENSNVVASGNDSGFLNLWDLRSGKIAQHLATNNHSLIKIKYASSGSPYVTCVGIDSTIWEFDLRTSTTCETDNFYKGWIECAQIDDDYAIVGGCDRLIKIYSRKNHSITKLIEGHSGSIFCCDFDRQSGNNLFLTGDSDSNIKLWDLDTYQNVNTLDDLKNSIQCLQFSDSKLVAGSVNYENNLTLYDFDPSNSLASTL